MEAVILYKAGPYITGEGGGGGGSVFEFAELYLVAILDTPFEKYFKSQYEFSSMTEDKIDQVGLLYC